MGASAGSGSWLLIQELFERGDPAFVTELRRFDDADTLAGFAPRWLADARPEARSLLFEYLDRPLNAYRHEALVKRLFKLAEAAGDDAVMARFLVAFDRSIRRVPAQRRRYASEILATHQDANSLAASWREQGFQYVWISQDRRDRYHVTGHWFEPGLIMPLGTEMPRGKMRESFDPTSWNRETRRYTTFSVPDWVYALRLTPMKFRHGGPIPDGKRKELERRRLFSVATRHYLRRRAWRYFRKLGRVHPERYLPAVQQALVLYRDDDTGDAAALLDNWGMIHILFRFNACLKLTDRAWNVAPGHTLAELEPAARYIRHWNAAPRVLVELLMHARCRAVRGWALRMIRKDLAAVLPVFPLEDRIRLLQHDDPDVVQLAAELMRGDPALRDVPAERWLGLVETVNPAALDILCELMTQLVPPDRVSLEQAVRFAALRPQPVARLGLSWLSAKTPHDQEQCRAVLALGEAECEALRPELTQWAAGVLSGSSLFQPDWVLEWLDSRHRDVRTQGWTWFRTEPRAHDDVTIWQRLLETPYDDVRLALIDELEVHAEKANAIRLERGDLNPELLRLLWASVLLNVHRGSRAKPMVVRHLLRRIEAKSDELPQLLSLIAVALRSLRGPEWRAGLSAVVRLAERNEATAGLVQQAFPELQLA